MRSGVWERRSSRACPFIGMEQVCGGGEEFLGGGQLSAGTGGDRSMSTGGGIRVGVGGLRHRARQGGGGCCCLSITPYTLRVWYCAEASPFPFLRYRKSSRQ